MKSTIQSSRSALLWAAPLSLLVGCVPTESGVHVKGQLVFREDRGCGAAVGSQETSWLECHRFKRQLDPADGSILDQNDRVMGSLRGYGSTVDLRFWSVPMSGDALIQCDSKAVQTDLHGRFEATLKACGDVGSQYIITGAANMQYTFAQRAGDEWGVVRGVWREDRALDLFGGSFGADMDQVHAYTSTVDNKRYAVPRFVFRHDGQLDTLGAALTGGSTTVNLGRMRLLDQMSEDPFGYVTQMLSGWQTILELHQRLRLELGDGKAYYDNMYTSWATPGWDRTYLVRFDDGWARAGKGRMWLFRPDRTKFEEDGLDWSVLRLLSSVATIGHELGHSIHRGMAPSALDSDYGWGNPLIDDEGTAYDWGHAGTQYQDVGTAMAEGLSSTMGQFLVNRCGSWEPGRLIDGGRDPFANNMWYPDESCDDTDGCRYHKFRYHMTERGVAEDSSDWDHRKGIVLGLNTLAVDASHRLVTSNSETRIAQFGCDLLDGDTDVSHAAGLVGGKMYMSDYTYRVGQAFDDDILAADNGVQTYDADPVSESVIVPFSTLVLQLEDYCKPDCPANIPADKAWGPEYNTKRLSTLRSPQSAHQLLRSLEDRGYVTRAQSRDLLKSNLMEDF